MKTLAALLIALVLVSPAALAANKTATFAVKGWTCGSCAVSTRIALKNLDGVTGVTTSDEKNEAVVAYDDSKVTPERMIQAIGKLGYSASLNETPADQPRSDRATPTGADVAKTTLSVTAISCDGCVAALEKQLKRTEGVSAFEVNQARGKAEVSYDPDATDAGHIAESLLRAGFKVVIAPWEPVDASFNGCSNGSCGTRIPNAAVSPQPGAAPGQQVYCPVSGVVLRIKDATPKVDVNGKPMYVCCEGCARHFKANRERVLALRGFRSAS